MKSGTLRLLCWVCFLCFFSSCFLAPQVLAAATTSTSQTEELRDGYKQRRRQTAELMELATVWVLVVGKNKVSSGSGFVVAEGYIMTNAHVTEGEKGLKIFVMNQFLSSTKATLVASSNKGESVSSNDFSLLRYTVPPSFKLPVLSFSTDVQRMDRVSTWGYPVMVTQFDKSMEDLDESAGKNIVPPPVVYTEGTVSTIVQNQGACIIHTAALAGGNSGGPLINRNGEVVGINTWVYKEEDEGSFVNASLTAAAMIDFLRANGITPQMAGQQDLVAAKGDSKPSMPITPVTPEKTAPESTVALSNFEQGLMQAASAYSQSSRQGQSSAQSQKPPGSGAVGSEPTDARVTDAQAKNKLRKAEQGDYQAMTEVGSGYLFGNKGFPQDLAKTVAWLEPASAADQPLAQALLGIVYIFGEAQHDPQKALALLRKSADTKMQRQTHRCFLVACSMRVNI